MICTLFNNPTKVSSFYTIMERVENCLSSLLFHHSNDFLLRLVLTDLLLSYIFVNKLQSQRATLGARDLSCAVFGFCWPPAEDVSN